MSASDAELVISAQQGDVTSLGMLLTRHHAGMQAVALSILGAGPDSEDAVQDAVVVAMQRIDQVRDPDAVGSWLRMIVRNGCRMRLRAPQPRGLSEREQEAMPDGAATPEELLERQSLREWVWHALAELSEPVRLAALLRYFTAACSYQQIAALSGVPVGTVRSRLSEARTKLAASLLATVDQAHDPITSIVRAREREAQQGMAAAQQGAMADVIKETWWPDAEMVLPSGRRAPRDKPGAGADLAVQAMDRDLTAGVRQRLTNIAASHDLSIWEAELISPPDDPEHCPPSVVWLHILREGRVRELRLFHPQPARQLTR